MALDANSQLYLKLDDCALGMFECFQLVSVLGNARDQLDLQAAAVDHLAPSPL